MARIIIGAGAGYLLGLFFVALAASSEGYNFSRLAEAAMFANVSGYMLACVAVGAVMGWAWHSIAIDAGSKDD